MIEDNKGKGKIKTKKLGKLQSLYIKLQIVRFHCYMSI